MTMRFQNPGWAKVVLMKCTSNADVEQGCPEAVQVFSKQCPKIAKYSQSGDKAVLNSSTSST